MSQFYMVEDGVYTGSQIHTDPRLAPLRENVARHRAARTVIEIRGGIVVNIAQTQSNVVTFKTHDTSLERELARVGVQITNQSVNHDWLGQNRHHNQATAQVADLERRLAAAEAKLEAAVSAAPKTAHEAVVKGLPLPSKTEMWKMRRPELEALALGSSIGVKAETMTRVQLLAWLSAEADYRSGDLNAHKAREAKEIDKVA
jgi:hypothetical protein